VILHKFQFLWFLQLLGSKADLINAVASAISIVYSLASPLAEENIISEINTLLHIAKRVCWNFLFRVADCSLNLEVYLAREHMVI
jgi:hypothetical protein